MNILLIGFSVGGVMGDGIKVLVKYFTKKSEVVLLTNTQLYIEDDINLRVHKFKFDYNHTSDFFNPVTYFKIYKVIKNTEYDVAFVYNGHPANAIAYRCVDLNKTVAFLHDPSPHSGKIPLKIRMASLLKRDMTKYAKIIVSSQKMKLVALQELGISDENKVQVNYLGGIENLFFEDLHLPQDIDVLFFGRVEYYKGIDTLIESAKQMPNARFVIAGKGDMKAAYGIDSLPKNVERFDRYLPDKELAALIQRSKVVVLPYRDATGTQTIQTAFYYGKPVVATMVGGFSEYIYDDVDGKLVPPCNADALTKAISEILDNSQRRMEMGAKAKEHLKDVFDNERICERYYEIFRMVIS